MFSKLRKKPVENVITEVYNYYYELTVLTKNQGTLSWRTNKTVKELKSFPWKEFYKWYFGSERENFMIRYNRGEALLKRSEIITFSVEKVAAKER